MAKPKIGQCAVVCNQGDIMPLMEYYVEEQGMSIRAASRHTEADFFDLYGQGSPVTASRAFSVYTKRKSTNKIDANESPKSSNDGGSERYQFDPGQRTYRESIEFINRTYDEAIKNQHQLLCSLNEIRDTKSYKLVAGYETFKEYCEKEHDLSPEYIQEMVDETQKHMSRIQAREIEELKAELEATRSELEAHKGGYVPQPD